MARYIWIVLVGLFGMVGKASAYDITLKCNHNSGMAYLTFYQGKSLYLEDSAMVNAKGVAQFKKDKKLVPGIYAIVFPGKRKTVDFLIDKSQNITITADTANLVDMTVSNSPENVLFKAYTQFTAKQGKLLMDERNAYEASKTKADSSLHEANYLKYNKELQEYRQQIIDREPQSMLAVLLKAMREPTVPEKALLTRQDTLDQFQYYKDHYWDGIDFMDDRIVRTPFFVPKLERYYRDVIGQMSIDSIKKDIDYRLLLARNAPELEKFLINWLTDEYFNPKYMGQDAIFLHLFDKIHSKGKSPWLNEKQMDAISRRAYMIMGNQVGEPAANLEMTDINGKLNYLYDVKADYTLVVFWDANCGHCKTEIPRIDSMYQASWKKKNIKIYAVETENDLKAWREFIKDHKLSEWTHVYEPTEIAELNSKSGKAGYKQLYDVTSTPTLYLLDKDKRILTKKLTFDQINKYLEYKEQGKNLY